MPVCSKGRLKVVATSAAAMLVAAANAPACAQEAPTDIGPPYVPAQDNAAPPPRYVAPPADEENPGPAAPNAGAAQGPAAQAPAAPYEPQPSPDQQIIDQEGLGLHGTDLPPLETQGSPAAENQAPSDVNPLAAPEPQYGLPAPITDTSDYTNYGKARPKKPKLYHLPKLQQPGALKLPPLETYKTAPDTQPRGSNPPYYDPADPGPSTAVIPTLPRPAPAKPDPTPFAPVGIDVGSLRLYPYVEADGGYDTNPNRLAQQVQASPFVYGETGLKLESLWSQNSFTADLRGGYYDYFEVPAANRPDAAGTITGRVDVTRQTQINLIGTFDIETQQPGSPIFAIPNSVFITNRPLVVTLGQSAGVTEEFNRLAVSLTGAFTGYIFGNATQSDGTELLLSQDDYNDYAAIAKAGYEITPGLIPFIQVTGDARRYADYLDVYGFARNSNGVAFEAGTTFEFTRLLTGQIGAGYAERVYVDPRLPFFDAPTVDGKLNYAVTPLTTINLNVATFLSETTLAFASGAVSRSVGLGVTHSLLPDVTLSANFTYQNNVYDGQPVTENLYTGTLKAEYDLNRNMVLTGSYAHSWFESTEPGENFVDDTVMLGLRLQD